MRILVLAGRSPGMNRFCSLMREVGFDVEQVTTVAEARSRARTLRPAVVVAGLFPDAEAGESALGLILAMQRHAPELMTILLTDSPLFAHGELFDMLGSLRCVLARTIPAEDLVEVIGHLLRREQGAAAEGMPIACGHCLVADQCRDAAVARMAIGAPAREGAEDLSPGPRCFGCGFGG